MKKNFAMRVAAILLVVTMLSLCMVSATYAKYTTSVSGSDTARVAKWGFTTTSITITDLFKNAYDGTVSASADVIAPGTTGSASFAFASDSTNKPEVAYNFTVDTTGSAIDATITANTNIQWKLDTGEWGTWDTLIASIKALSGDASGTKRYEAGTLPTAFSGAGSHTVSWQWVFTGNDTGDTSMGNATTLAEVTLKINVTATQID